jgi:hypothetical protein
MFAPERHVMAYSDTFLPLTPIFRIVEGITGSPIVAMNVLYIGGWLMCAEFTYWLLARLTSSRSAAFTGAIAFTFATVRMAQADHYQLVFAGFIPLAVVLLVRLMDEPSMLGGVLLALSVTFQFLTAAYFGVVLLPVIGVALAVFLVLGRRGPLIRRQLAASATAAVTTLAILIPVGYHYWRAQDETGSRGWYPWFLVFRPRDLFAAYPASKHLHRFDVLEAPAWTQQSGNFAYVGWFVLSMVPVFAVLVAASPDMRTRLRAAWGAWLVVAALAILGLGIAIGNQRVFGIPVPVYRIARAVIPGVRSMIAIGRLTLFLQFALVAAATAGFAALLRSVPLRGARVALASVATALIMIESAIHVPMTRVPVVSDGSVYAILRDLDDDGTVAELPIVPPGEPLMQAFLEPSRMVLGSGDGHRTVNGYSGYTPLSYEALTAALGGFPSPESIDALREADVRYVVLHTTPLDTGTANITEMVNAGPFAYFPPERIDQIERELPPGLVVRRFDATDGIVLEIAPRP